MRHESRALGMLLVLTTLMLVVGSMRQGNMPIDRSAQTNPPASLMPRQPEGARGAPGPRPAEPPSLLSQPGDVAWGATPAVIANTQEMEQEGSEPFMGIPSLVRNMLPKHVKPTPAGEGPANALVAGQTLDEPRTQVESMFPTIGATGWNPPDPTMAVGPSHVVVTVNASIAFYNKATGSQTFRTGLANANGFFGGLGAGGFVFDPKVVYDHYSGRFIVVALEVYDPNQAWIDLAISDDSDPNGTWYKYRTDAVIDIGGSTVWWDFPGIGYDADAIYVTGNLFGLNGGPYGGVGFRTLTKSSILGGGAAVYSTLRSPGLYTCMPALHFGTNGAAFFANIQNSTTMRIYAIRNPLTTPTLVSTSVTTPSYTGAIEAPSLNASPVSNAGITMPYFRNNRLWVIHNASTNGRNIARWHEFNLGTWPTSGGVIRVQSGDVDAGPGMHTLFPAIGINSTGDVGVSVGVTSQTSRIAAAIAGRRAGDPTGRMGVPVIVKTGEADGGGRWGDYYSVAVDPVDGTTFWAIGEYQTPSGWQNWVSSFRVQDQSLCHPVADDLGTMEIGVSAPAAVDVLANDWHSNSAVMTISTFTASSTRGGTITRSVGTGPGGRDRLIYTPPATGPGGADSFSYTVQDSAGNSASAAVTVQLFDPSTYRVAENPPTTRSGIQVAWYVVTGAPSALPNFATLTPYQYNLVTSVNVPATTGNFSSSGRADDLGAVYEGYVDVVTQGVYTFYLNSDDGSKMYLGDLLIINNDGLHGATEIASARIGLRPGKHRVRIEYYETTGSANLAASWSSLTLAKQVIPVGRWFSVRPCPSNFEIAPDLVQRRAILSWTPGVGFDPAPVTIRRGGQIIASLGATASTFTDAPVLVSEGRHEAVEYSVESTGGTCNLGSRRVLLSTGTVRYAETFDSFADSAALAAAGWIASNTATATETGALWTLDQGRAANPPGFDGVPTSGRYVISDSALSAGTNPVGTGASHDLISPTIDCTGLSTVFLHFDAVAQLNNDGSAIFDVDVRTAANPTWTNVLRRVAPSRTSPAPAVTVQNADGVFGRVSIDLTSRAANAQGVQVRFRHFEPTDDWFVAIDNVSIDNVNPAQAGSTTLFGTATFSTPIAAPWQIRSPRTGTATWTIADPCRRSVSGNGGIFPRLSGQAVHRLGPLFALCDSNCNTVLVHDDFLITPVVDCSRAERVYLHFRSEAIVSAPTVIEVLVSLDGGATFLSEPLLRYDVAALQDAAEDPYFDVRSLHAPQAAFQSRVAFAFHYANAGGGMWWGVDDVRIAADLRCPSDFNLDGAVDGDDVIAFFTAWDLGNADYNNDGGTDGDDVIAFFGAWDSGC